MRIARALALTSLEQLPDERRVLVANDEPHLSIGIVVRSRRRRGRAKAQTRLRSSYIRCLWMTMCTKSFGPTFGPLPMPSPTCARRWTCRHKDRDSAVVSSCWGRQAPLRRGVCEPVRSHSSGNPLYCVGRAAVQGDRPAPLADPALVRPSPDEAPATGTGEGSGGGVGIQPLRLRSRISAREEIPSLVKTWRRWESTVRGLRYSCAATFFVLAPVATSWAT